MVEMQERRENCSSVMVDKERLDPHGVGNLPHKSVRSTFGVRG